MRAARVEAQATENLKAAKSQITEARQKSEDAEARALKAEFRAESAMQKVMEMEVRLNELAALISGKSVMMVCHFLPSSQFSSLLLVIHVKPF